MFARLLEPDALWFSVPALCGSAIFLLRILLMSFGADHDGDVASDAHLDVHFDTHLDGDGAPELHDHGSDHAFTILSVQGLSAFLMGFGWGGVGAHLGSGWTLGASALLGVGTGFGMAYLLGWLLALAMQLQSSGTLRPESALGALGDVYLTVPEHGAGSGQVRVVIGNRMRIFRAVSLEGALPTSSRVRVVSVDDDHTLVVAAA
ncbi:MAG: hypothetical protein H6825_12710 [Planctomycetes bacterium]|nr:hypothetical protein [Planctomycetota bacterium]